MIFRQQMGIALRVRFYYTITSLFLSIFLLFCLFSCASAHRIKPVSHEELARRDNAVGLELAQYFERHIKFKHDTEVSLFLRHLAQKLADSSPELRGSQAGVWLIRQVNGKWFSFSLPGNRVYLPFEFLRTLDFENEIAASIALELGHVLRRDVQKRISRISAIMNAEAAGEPITFSTSRVDNSNENEKDKDKDLPEEDISLKKMIKSHHDYSLTGLFSVQPKEIFYRRASFFGPEGVFAYSEKAEVAAIKEAVGIMYRSGYDPRGIISIYLRFLQNPKHSPYEISTLNRMLEQARTQIAQTAPLRNPIVRSQRYLLIQKRIQRL